LDRINHPSSVAAGRNVVVVRRSISGKLIAPLESFSLDQSACWGPFASASVVGTAFTGTLLRSSASCLDLATACLLELFSSACISHHSVRSIARHLAAIDLDPSACVAFVLPFETGLLPLRLGILGLLPCYIVLLEPVITLKLNHNRLLPQQHPGTHLLQMVGTVPQVQSVH
jgi:hypothetical protein